MKKYKSLKGPLVETILEIKNYKELYEFLTAILTPAEFTQISKRLQIIRLLKKKVPQVEISEKLKIGIATVTRGSRMLNEGRFKNVK